MKKTQLIDLFGLSGDQSDDDQLDNLLFRLESETTPAFRETSKRIRLPSFVTVAVSEPRRYSFQSVNLGGIASNRADT